MPDKIITRLLQDWSTGDSRAEAELLPLVYEDLRRIAASHLRQERGSHTLQATAIVHEAFLRLHGQPGFEWPSREHFFAFAAHLIRRILVDYARGRNRAKRGGEAERVPLIEMADQASLRAPELVALDDALTTLEALDPRKAAVVELRFFGGLTMEETATHLGVSPETIGREWRRAKAWLYHELHPDWEQRA
ncbi:MAG: sigma-70 family RNA polymerase sigma factor [Thermoanaerobaculia bacterium]